MATRRRRTQPSTPVEPTHEEMLELAVEREAEQVVEEEVPMEVIMSAALCDTFEAIQKAEEEKGVADFFDPGSYKEEVRAPAEPTGFVPEVPKKQPRFILRDTKRTNYRRG